MSPEQKRLKQQLVKVREADRLHDQKITAILRAEHWTLGRFRSLQMKEKDKAFARCILKVSQDDIL